MQATSGRVTRTPRRRALACQQCRKKKLKCDHSQPCSNCSRARNKTCTYAPATTADDSATPEPRPSQPSINDAQTRHSLSSAPRAEVSGRLEALNTKSQDSPGSAQSERWVPSAVASLLLPSEGSRNGPARNQDTSKTIPISSSLEGLSGPVRGAIFKSRFFSPSNWICSVLLVCLFARLMKCLSSADKYCRYLKSWPGSTRNMPPKATLYHSGKPASL